MPAGKAISFGFAPRFDELAWTGVREALGHSFFTLSLGMGAMLKAQNERADALRRRRHRRAWARAC